MYMEIEWNGGFVEKNYINLGRKHYKILKAFTHLKSVLTNKNSIYEVIKCRLQPGNSCNYSVQIPLSRFISKNLNIEIYKTILPFLLWYNEVS